MRGRDIVIAIGVVVIAVLVLGGFGGGMMLGWGAMGPGMMGGYGYVAGPWMWLMMLVVWSVVIGGIALLVVGLLRGAAPIAPPGARPRPLEILQERYARGEISREEYERTRAVLTETKSAAGARDDTR